MDVDAQSLSRSQARSLLTSAIVPRPIAWVSTVSIGKTSNLAPFSSVAPVCNKPAMLAFSCGRRTDGTRKDTARNILETGEFVVNFVGPEFLEKLSLSAHPHEPGIDECALLGVAVLPSTTVKVGRVADAVSSLECRLVEVVEVGDDDCRVDVILGLVLRFHFKDRPDQGSRAGLGPQFCGIGALGLDEYLFGGDVRILPQS